MEGQKKTEEERSGLKQMGAGIDWSWDSLLWLGAEASGTRMALGYFKKVGHWFLLRYRFDLRQSGDVWWILVAGCTASTSCATNKRVLSVMLPCERRVSISTALLLPGTQCSVLFIGPGLCAGYWKVPLMSAYWLLSVTGSLKKSVFTCLVGF